MLPKRTASEMMGSSGKAEDGPFKRMREMLEENADKVTFSNKETEEFRDLIQDNNLDITGHKYNIKMWRQHIKDTQKVVGELEKTNKQYKEDIEKNREEIVGLKQEEEVIMGILKQGEIREKALKKFVQKDLTKFLEGELEKAGLSLEKESGGDQDEKIAGDGEKKTVKNET